jgi:predicted ABC-type ATPase
LKKTNKKPLHVADAPIFYLLAGPNGAGKSTLYKTLAKGGVIDPHAEFVNADLYEAAHLQYIQDLESRSIAARDWADNRRANLLRQKQSFVSETVFSHESKITLIDEAKLHGFQVMLLVVGLDNPELLLKRISHRVKEGGHDVPADRVLARYPRTLANLKIAIPKAQLAILYHTDGAGFTPHYSVAVCQNGVIVRRDSALPQWAKTVLGLAD